MCRWRPFGSWCKQGARPACRTAWPQHPSTLPQGEGHIEAIRVLKSLVSALNKAAAVPLHATPWRRLTWCWLDPFLACTVRGSVDLYGHSTCSTCCASGCRKTPPIVIALLHEISPTKTHLVDASVSGHVQGCEPDVKDRDDCTPLYCAAAWNQAEAVRCLDSMGCPSWVRSSDQRTAVHVAAEQGWTDLIDLLVRQFKNRVCLETVVTPEPLPEIAALSTRTWACSISYQCCTLHSVVLCACRRKLFKCQCGVD